MDELIKEIVAKTGIPEQSARTAVETVVRFLKEKLPAPIAGQLDGLFDNSDLADQAGNALKGLGGLLGRK